MTSNDKVLVLMIFLLAAGISCGAFFEVFMEGSGKEQLSNLLSSMFTEGHSANFWQGLIKSLANCIFVLAIPFSVIYFKPFILLCPFIPFIKGLSLGFSATMIVETFGYKGIFHILTTLLPQNLIQLPVLCYLTALSVVSVKRQNKKALQQDARPYYLSYCIGCCLLFISCLLEACLMKLVL